MVMTMEEFEAQAALGLIQPNGQCHWDCNRLGLPTSHDHLPGGSLHLSATAAAAARLELSKLMEHVVQQLSDDASADGAVECFSAASLSAENYAAMASECRLGRQNAEKNHHGLNEALWNDPGREELHQDCGGPPTRNLKTAGVNGGDGVGEERSMRLLGLLLECAVAISVDDLPEANRVVLELTHVASPYSPSCAERLVAYFAQAMASRVMNSWLGLWAPLSQVDHKALLISEFQVFSRISPFVKFAHFTANQAIMEALHQRDSAHIVDLDTMQGLQWPALLHALATRPGGPPRVRMTALGSSAETGRRLCDVARRLGVPFEFRAVAKRSGDIDPALLGTRRGEAAAVHWLRHSLYDATGPDRGTMRLLELIAPRVITLVEQEVVQAGSFLDRFAGSLHYYATMFDSLGASLSREDPSRHRVESCLLAKEVNNMLAIGGPARTGEEKFASWRAQLARDGRFAQLPMSCSSMAQAQLVLSMFPRSHGYTLDHGDGTLGLGWKGTRLYTASAWTSQEDR